MHLKFGLVEGVSGEQAIKRTLVSAALTGEEAEREYGRSEAGGFQHSGCFLRIIVNESNAY